MIVAIDGPAGAGKSTVARALAARLGCTYLDTGAMYRALAVLALERGVGPADGDQLGALARANPVSLLPGGKVGIAGRDVTEEIRTPEVDAVVSAVAGHSAVREVMRARQRELSLRGDCVMEGRDIGTVVAPQAEVKVYLVADPEERVRRRLAERPGADASADAAALLARDASDEERMQPAEDAVLLDTTGLGVEQVVDRIEQMARDAREALGPEPERPPRLLGTVAIVGFPNVGKSTLINRLTQSRAAVVHDMPGVTRDRKELICEWGRDRFRIVDTGGVDIASDDPITQGIARQAKAAIEEADLVLFVVDARHGITPGDEELAAIIRAAKKPVILIANKIDDPRKDLLALEFHRLGIGDPFPLSALHGHGTGDLLDLIVGRLPGDGGEETGEEAIRVAILGRPNVGKSSLLNALVGGDRVLVSEIPGTTRDAIDTVLERGDTTFVLVDTAGLRRKRHQRQGVEYYSELRALQAAHGADVALVLIDASEGLVEHDLSVADEARKAQCSTLVVLSKWDINDVDIETLRLDLQQRLRQRPPVVAVSAKTGRGLQRMLDKVEELSAKHRSRIPTPELNRFLKELSAMRQAPSKGPKKLNLLYGTQVQTRPPRFRFFVNDPALITRDYGYWVENQLRERYELQGVPVSIDFVARG